MNHTTLSVLVSGERGDGVPMHLARLLGDQSDRAAYRGTRAPITLGVSRRSAVADVPWTSTRGVQQVSRKSVDPATLGGGAYRDRLQGRGAINLEPADKINSVVVPMNIKFRAPSDP